MPLLVFGSGMTIIGLMNNANRNAVKIVPSDRTFFADRFIGELVRGFFRKEPARAAGFSGPDGYRIELDSEELGRFMVAAARKAERENWTGVPFDLVVG